MLLARTLWREGYDDHLAGHITYRQPDGTLLCNPWLLLWEELRPEDVLRIDLDGNVLEGDWPVPLGHPAPPRAPQARRDDVTVAVHTIPASARSGPTSAGCPVLRPELGAGRRASWCWSTSTTARSTPATAGPGGGRHGSEPTWRCWPTTGCSCSPAASGPPTSGRWPSSSGAGTPGTSRPWAAAASCPSRPAPSSSASDGEGFIGFWEAMARRELRLDPDAARPLRGGRRAPTGRRSAAVWSVWEIAGLLD